MNPLVTKPFRQVRQVLWAWTSANGQWALRVRDFQDINSFMDVREVSTNREFTCGSLIDEVIGNWIGELHWRYPDRVREIIDYLENCGDFRYISKIHVYDEHSYEVVETTPILDFRETIADELARSQGHAFYYSLPILRDPRLKSGHNILVLEILNDFTNISNKISKESTLATLRSMDAVNMVAVAIDDNDIDYFRLVYGNYIIHQQKYTGEDELEFVLRAIG